MARDFLRENNWKTRIAGLQADRVKKARTCARARNNSYSKKIKKSFARNETSEAF
jgi:hypothetical protein